MDERLKKALDFSNYMVALNNQKRLLTEKYQENQSIFIMVVSLVLQKS